MIIYWFVLVLLLEGVNGRARLVDPPMRSSIWREHIYNVPVNVLDEHLNCGGYEYQWEVAHGKCGTCGDPFFGPINNMYPGIYANNVKLRTAEQGTLLNVTVFAAKNLLGHFRFNVCPINGVEFVDMDDCFRRNPLKIFETNSTKYFVGSGAGHHDMRLMLPPELYCNHCVLQWVFVTGYREGRDLHSCRDCLGCGQQETYINCADITITRYNPVNPVSTRTQRPPIVPTTSAPTTTTAIPTTIPTTTPTTSPPTTTVTTTVVPTTVQPTTGGSTRRNPFLQFLPVRTTNRPRRFTRQTGDNTNTISKDIGLAAIVLTATKSQSAIIPFSPIITTKQPTTTVFQKTTTLPPRQETTTVRSTTTPIIQTTAARTTQSTAASTTALPTTSTTVKPTTTFPATTQPVTTLPTTAQTTPVPTTPVPTTQTTTMRPTTMHPTTTIPTTTKPTTTRPTTTRPTTTIPTTTRPTTTTPTTTRPTTTIPTTIRPTTTRPTTTRPTTTKPTTTRPTTKKPTTTRPTTIRPTTTRPTTTRATTTRHTTTRPTTTRPTTTRPTTTRATTTRPTTRPTTTRPTTTRRMITTTQRRDPFEITTQKAKTTQAVFRTTTPGRQDPFRQTDKTTQRMTTLSRSDDIVTSQSTTAAKQTTTEITIIPTTTEKQTQAPEINTSTQRATTVTPSPTTLASFTEPAIPTEAPISTSPGSFGDLLLGQLSQLLTSSSSDPSNATNLGNGSEAAETILLLGQLVNILSENQNTPPTIGTLRSFGISVTDASQLTETVGLLTQLNNVLQPNTINSPANARPMLKSTLTMPTSTIPTITIKPDPLIVKLNASTMLARQKRAVSSLNPVEQSAVLENNFRRTTSTLKRAPLNKRARGIHSPANSFDQGDGLNSITDDSVEPTISPTFHLLRRHAHIRQYSAVHINVKVEHCYPNSTYLRCLGDGGFSTDEWCLRQCLTSTCPEQPDCLCFCSMLDGQNYPLGPDPIIVIQRLPIFSHREKKLCYKPRPRWRIVTGIRVWCRRHCPSHRCYGLCSPQPC